MWGPGNRKKFLENKTDGRNLAASDNKKVWAQLIECNQNEAIKACRATVYMGGRAIINPELNRK